MIKISMIKSIKVLKSQKVYLFKHHANKQQSKVKRSRDKRRRASQYHGQPEVMYGVAKKI